MKARHDIRSAVDELPLTAVCDATTEGGAWVVGGVIRDLLRGDAATPDIDVAIDSEVEPVAARLAETEGVEVEATHSRFGTATVSSGGLRIDLSRTRRETYAHPGALPDVEPAGIEADLERRDFTVNAMAMRLGSDEGILDPTGGADDLEAGVLRVLHDASFVDDPTRAIRAARYASRLGLAPDPKTHELLRATDLATVSDDRRRAETARLAAEPTAPAGFRMLAEWGVLDLSSARLDLIAAVDQTAGRPPWAASPLAAESRAAAIVLVVDGGEALHRALVLGAALPDRPSEAVRLGAGRSPEEILVAAAAGGDWLTDFVERWRHVELEIDGDDLVAAGIPTGPAVGVGLQGALERKLDGGLNGGREAELELAVELAKKALDEAAGAI